MPLDVFDGEPIVHEHYDADGNLTGSTVIPGWSDDARAWALGLALREAHECPRGHFLPESSHTDWRWKADEPLVCFACSALNSEMTKHKDDKLLHSQLFSVHKVPAPKKRGG